MKSAKINIHIFLRKPFKFENHSIEKLFKTIVKKKDKDFKFKFLICPFVSSGFFKRLFNCLWAYFNQGDVNHITGDINFISLFLNKNKTISTFLDCYSLRKYSGIKKLLLKLFWFYLPIHNSRYITTVSNFTKKELKILLKIKKKITIIPGFLPSLNYKLEKYDKKKFLIIGTTENKNLERILHAIKEFKIEIIIIGRMKLNQIEYLKNNQMKYKNYIDISDRKLLDFYNQAKVLLFPSLYEGFGLPIIEAQRMCVPVITSNISPMKEIVKKSALLVAPKNVTDIKNKCNQIINDKKLRNNLIKKGYKNSFRFEPKKSIDNYFRLYKKIFQENCKR